MAITLRAESFAEINIQEITLLTANASAGATSLTVKSTAGYSVNQAVYVGTTGQDGCEVVYVSAVASATSLTLSAALTLPHSKYEPVTGVVGDKVRIYRAANVDGTAPDDGDFSLLATQQIDADELSTYYTDSTGSSSYWYKFTYYNATTTDETELGASTAFRGDDYGHYGSLSQIRREAGFENAINLNDTAIDQQRRAAEAEINSKLSNHYTVPFTDVPALVQTLTIQLAAGLLLMAAYGSDNSRGKMLVEGARKQLEQIQAGEVLLYDDDAADSIGEGVTSWPDDTTADADSEDGGGARLFRIGDVW